MPWKIDLLIRPGYGDRIPDDIRQRIVDLALEVPELSPRELAIRFTDTENTLSRRHPFIACLNLLI